MTQITWTLREFKISELTDYAKNPRSLTKKQFDQLKASLDKFGMIDKPIVNADAAHTLIGGHQRVKVLRAERAASVECWYPSRELDDKEVEELNIRLNKNTGAWDFDILANQFEVPDLIEWGFEPFELVGFEKPGKPKGGPNPRNLPIDVIYTLQMADCTCCLAVQAGLSYGIQSARYRLCPYTDELGERHKVMFIDNDYFDYKHDDHLKVVQFLKPKYATVMDVMTKEQCQKDKVSFFELSQILEWAEELSQYAENVIVIPKYAEALDKIPDKFMLGYSVPTSHGGTPLPVESFKGRRVHLLGGSWKDQLAHMAVLGDDCVSLDTNYVQKIAKFGNYVTPEGEAKQMQEIGFGYLTNVRYATLALSFGAIGSKINEICGTVSGNQDKTE
jgi:hypothetical protein